MANALIGIKTLHKLRCEETLRVFEHLIEKGEIVDDIMTKYSDTFQHLADTP